MSTRTETLANDFVTSIEQSFIYKLFLNADKAYARGDDQKGDILLDRVEAEIERLEDKGKIDEEEAMVQLIKRREQKGKRG